MPTRFRSPFISLASGELPAHVRLRDAGELQDLAGGRVAHDDADPGLGHADHVRHESFDGGVRLSPFRGSRDTQLERVAEPAVDRVARRAGGYLDP
jgi:hypothetical protein